MPLDAVPLNLDGLPAVLAGPMVRRLTRTDVTVWVALRLSDDVTLNIRPAGSADLPVTTTVSPTRIGRNLWLAVLTGQAPDSDFNPGADYEYWLSSPGWPAAATPDWGGNSFSYAGAATPAFRASPAALADLQLVHSSCRKPHGQGRDAVAVLDDLIADVVTPRPKPHLLMLTGDQIYADDVAAPLVPRLRRLAEDLVDIDEDDVFGPLPLIGGRQAPTEGFGLTSGSAANHLWTFGEYVAMYLLAFSDVLWPSTLPAWAAVDVGADLAAGHGLSEEIWTGLVERTHRYRDVLPKVRRVLANVPTMMIFDDHEITDDWNLDLPWAQAVYGAPEGRRIITNGLLAYLLFQHWGNVPERFSTTGTPEANLLAAVTWTGSGTSPDSAGVRAALGIPDAVGAAPTELRDITAAGAVRYDVLLEPDRGWPVRIVVLDERTARGYPTATGPAARISETAIPEMLPAPPTGAPGVATLVAAPSPVVGFRFVEHMIQPAAALFLGNEPYDFETWTAVGPTFELLLERLSAYGDVVILSGDVHFGFTKRLDYDKPPSTRLMTAAAVTASSAKNAETAGAVGLQLLGDLMTRLGIVRPRSFAGFDALTPAQLASLAAPPPPGSELPYDDVVDVLLGRVFRAGAETPAVFTTEIANAYALGTPDWTYRTELRDDESLPSDPADLANVTAVAGLAPWAGWDPANSFQVVRGLQASDRNRIGRLFMGLPQVAWMTFSADEPRSVTSEYVLAAGAETNGTMRTTTTVLLG